MSTAVFPIRPFDGQIFIDAQRVRWVFNTEEKCWVRDGMATEIPVASTTQTGLLSAQLKQLIDSIPPKGGHFGIVARPLLSVKPTKHDNVLKDQVEHAYKTEAGSSVRSLAALESAFEEDAYAGKLLRFTSGILNDTAFLIAGNSDTEFRLLGNASMAAYNDKFEIIEPTALNINGVIAGSIELVSESLDIDCVDAQDEPIDEDCTTPPVALDGLMPALDFKVSDLFKAQFCVQQPGCEGHRGNKGAKGDSGADGTGDGPQGDTGDPGENAPTTPFTLEGLRIVDIDDIYDTAVVGLEVDAPNGRLNVVKAKMRTPDNNTPADQLIVTEIFRAIEFTGSGFDFELKSPSTDPVGVDDVKLGYYPQGFDAPAEVVNKPLSSAVATMPLSEFVGEISDYWQVQLDKINAAWDDQIREFTQNKDKEARMILAQLCHQLAECEWERPIEFCIGLKEGDCRAGGASEEEAAAGAPGPVVLPPESNDPYNLVNLLPNFGTIPPAATPPDPNTIAGGGDAPPAPNAPLGD